MRNVLLLALLGAGCAGSYWAYEPIAGTSSGYDGRIASDWTIPGGDVRVVPMGLAEVRPRPDQKESFRALHVRMVLDNRSGMAWRVRADEQLARLDRWGPSLPSDAAVGRDRVRDVIVPGGSEVAIDLFYPLPEPNYGPELPSGFSLDWRVHTTDGVAAKRTEFDRRRIDAQTAANRLNRL